MILLNYKNCNTFFEKDEICNFEIEEKVKKLEKYIDEYENNINYGYIECPICESTKMISYGSYERNIGIFDQYFKIKIKRVKCKECNHTHALLPSFILPYFQNEVSFIEIVIKEKYNNKSQTSYIVNAFNISRQLINNWLRRFRNHLSRLRSTISNDIEVIIKKLFEGVFVREKYKILNNIRFLEKIPT